MWTIHLLKNTVKLTDEAKEEICKELVPDYFYDESDFDYAIEDDLLPFNSDADEHIDHLNFTKDILVKHKVKGEVIFADFEGRSIDKIEDCFWGYRFDGKGSVEDIKVKITFE